MWCLGWGILTCGLWSSDQRVNSLSQPQMRRVLGLPSSVKRSSSRYANKLGVDGDAGYVGFEALMLDQHMVTVAITKNVWFRAPALKTDVWVGGHTQPPQ